MTSRLTEIRKSLKPLLATVLAGQPWEPWRRVSGPGADADPAVVAACVVSFVTRRDLGWDRWRGRELERRVTDLVNREVLAPQYAVWPFLDALAAALRGADWAAIDAAMQPYRDAWSAAFRAFVARIGGGAA